MHKEFSAWYRTASIEHSPELLQRRWLAVSALIATPTIAAIKEIARCYFNVGEGSTDTVIRAAAKAADSTFPNDGANLELRVLAGTALRILFDTGTPSAQSDFALMILLTSSFGSRASSVPTPQHHEAALKALAIRGHAVRRNAIQQELKVRDLTALPSSMTAAVSANVVNKLHEPLNEVVQALLELRSTVADQAIRLSGVSEEADLLWWIFGGATITSTHKPISSLDEPARPLAIGYELAQGTKFWAPPVSSAALIRKVLELSSLNSDKQFGIAECIDASDRAWRKAVCLQVPDPVISPLRYAIHCSLQVGPEGGWNAIFEHSSSMAADAKATAGLIANQIYQEMLLDLFFGREA